MQKRASPSKARIGCLVRSQQSIFLIVGRCVGLKRQYAGECRTSKIKCGRLLHVLAKEGAQVLHNFIWGLCQTMVDTEFDKHSDCIR
jgi:hypothetical protein